jgi:hypothetical protein
MRTESAMGRWISAVGMLEVLPPLSDVGFGGRIVLHGLFSLRRSSSTFEVYQCHSFGGNWAQEDRNEQRE